MTTLYGTLHKGRILDTSWTKEGLLKAIQTRTSMPFTLDEIEHLIVEIPVPPTVEVIKWYFEKRGLLYAQNPVDALMFLNSEIGELNDAIVHRRGEWVRNNDREREIGPEIGDVLMMLCVTAERLDADPLDEMLKKFAKKGYPVHE